MIIITGMHRSGTSLIAGLLHAIGADFGPDALLLPADRWNPAGYFENLEVLSLNDALVLGDLERSSIYLKTPPDNRSSWMKLRRVLSLWGYVRTLRKPGVIHERAERYHTVMDDLCRKYNGTFVKDQRFTLTLPYWQTVTPIKRVCFTYRHPLSVAQSLKRRQHIPIRFGLNLWQQHVSQFLAHAHNWPTTYVNYDDLFEDDRTQDQALSLLAEFSQIPDAFNRLKSCNVLRSELRHFRNTRLPRSVASLYDQLRILAARQSVR